MGAQSRRLRRDGELAGGAAHVEPQLRLPLHARLDAPRATALAEQRLQRQERLPLQHRRGHPRIAREEACTQPLPSACHHQIRFTRYRSSLRRHLAVHSTRRRSHRVGGPASIAALGSSGVVPVTVSAESWSAAPAAPTAATRRACCDCDIAPVCGASSAIAACSASTSCTTTHTRHNTLCRR